MDSERVSRRHYLGGVTATISCIGGCLGQGSKVASICDPKSSSTNSERGRKCQLWDFETVAGPFDFTEGPVWDGTGVLFSDIPNSRIMRYDTLMEECTVYRMDTNYANGLKLNDAGELFACEMGGRRVARYDPDGSDVTVAAEYNGTRLNSPNDLTFDNEGRLWFTDPFYDAGWLADDHEPELPHRSVYRADPVGDDEWDLKRMTYDTTNPNGLLVSPNDEWLYVAQSDATTSLELMPFRNCNLIPTVTLRVGKWIPKELFSIDVGKNLELRGYPTKGNDLGTYDVLHDFAPHRAIDGMCFDSKGNIVATAGSATSGPGPMIYVFNPRGEILETHPSPDPKPTNCAFGGSDLRTLYLTGSEGYLYRARTDRRGLRGAPDTQ